MDSETSFFILAAKYGLQTGKRSLQMLVAQTGSLKKKEKKSTRSTVLFAHHGAQKDSKPTCGAEAGMHLMLFFPSTLDPGLR